MIQRLLGGLSLLLETMPLRSVSQTDTVIFQSYTHTLHTLHILYTYT